MLTNDQNFGKTIGISYDSADHNTVEMIEQELNKNGLRVWTTYDHINDHFIPSFISVMNNTDYLIICLSDMYRLNNRCRTELLYATASGHRVLSWKINIATNNQDQDEKIRLHAMETLLNRIIPNEFDKTQVTLTPITDTAHVDIHMEKRAVLTNFNRRQQVQKVMSLENWTNMEVLTWCQSINLSGFSILLANVDGRSVVRLYEFCKQNSTETVTLLNNDLHNICQQDNIPDTHISVNEFIRFQIEVEKLLPSTPLKNSSVLYSPSKLDFSSKRFTIKTCTIL